MRYIATFTPEAWVRDQAIEVDPEGETEWDCTGYALAHAEYVRDIEGRGMVIAGEGILDNDDVFKDDPAAPEWVRAWRGPFNIRIRAINDDRSATFHQYTGPGTHAAIEVRGVMAFLYVEHGTVRVSVDLDTADPSLMDEAGEVPVQITVQGDTVFTA